MGHRLKGETRLSSLAFAFSRDGAVGVFIGMHLSRPLFACFMTPQTVLVVRGWMKIQHQIPEWT